MAPYKNHPLSVRTLQRWRPVGETTVQSDGRPTAMRPMPPHRLTDAERERIVEVSNAPGSPTCHPRRSCRSWPIRAGIWPRSQASIGCSSLISDLFSRYGVHWEVHERECGELAAELIEQAIWREQCQASPPVLHSDNGGPMTSLTLRAKLLQLNVASSSSRPRVSDDKGWVPVLSN